MNILKNKAMNLTKKTALILMMVAVVSSCDDFGDLNEDPNNPSQVKTELLLTSAQRSVSSVTGSVVGTIYVQYIAETQYTDDSQYSSSTYNFNGWYTGPLQDLQTIIDLNSDEVTKADVLSGGSNANQIAAARILKAYFFHVMADRWGALPYTEALQGRENFTPSYDTQQDIYADLIKELKEAVAQMDDGEGVNGDILFSGDMQQWAMFANSLRARIALRMADVNSSVAEAEFTDALNDGIITEDVMYPYLGNADNENPWYSRFRTRTDYAISDVMANYMLGLNDYRITRYADPAEDLSNNDGETTFDEINGMDYDAENAGDITNASISFPGKAIREQSAPLPIVTTAEMNFAKAEAVERGWISGSAEDYYLQAIEDSWSQWNVYDADNYSAYVNTAEVAYSSAEWKKKIGTQKWVALFPLGYEAWGEWRRLSYPELTPHAFALNASGEIPVRHVYPTSESQINEEAYKNAVEVQGPDTPDTHLWWDITD
ncbi:MAG: SusD/RagB family nutrient-binding outer membrane lipoprotein [Balneolaceae bacterium]|nr:SusD/RagB family nutrient-binding outer membrane lipoprotein [Balneolaceae bacterium]